MDSNGKKAQRDSRVSEIPTDVTRPFRIFISYSHVDEPFRESLDKHLAPLLLLGRTEAWHDRHIQAGARLYEKIQGNIENADIVLLLISADYLASKACQGEMATAVKKSDDRTAVAIPIIIRACNWTILPIGQLLAANQDGKPINSHSDSDVAWTQVACKIGEIINEWEVERQTGNNGDDGVSASPVAEDEQSLKPAHAGAPSERWVARREENDADWEEVKRQLNEILISQATSEDNLNISLNVRPWNDKIIVDFTLPQHQNSRRLIIRDIGGYVGYPGYQLEYYSTDDRVGIEYNRIRWLVSTDGIRLFRQTMPKGSDMTVQQYAEGIWKKIKTLAKA